MLKQVMPAPIGPTMKPGQPVITGILGFVAYMALFIAIFTGLCAG